jgi:uncharacterized ion transporter superfamily protein YfcC
MVFGILKYQWFILEIGGVFLAMGIFSGIAGRLTSDELGRSFVEGAKDTVNAALIIPIMAPLGDLVAITRQTAVFAFQLAEYINPVLPTSGVTMGVLGLAGLRWEKWAKWLVPLLILWVLFAVLTLIPPGLMKWGPA